MSLSAQEQQALESIEDRLTASDPKLASLLATFARLTSGEAMPAREKVRARLRRPARRRWRPRPDRVCQSAARLCRRLGWQRVMLLLCLTVVIAVAAVALIINSGGRESACTGSWALTCAHQTSTHSSRPAAPGSG